MCSNFDYKVRDCLFDAIDVVAGAAVVDATEAQDWLTNQTKQKRKSQMLHNNAYIQLNRE